MLTKYNGEFTEVISQRETQFARYLNEVGVQIDDFRVRKNSTSVENMSEIVVCAILTVLIENRNYMRTAETIHLGG